MTSKTNISTGRLGVCAIQLATVSLLAVSLSACRPGEEPDAHVAGWAVIDPAQRHPIVVSQQPANLTLRIARGSSGLTPQQRATVIDFMSRYRAGDTGNGRLTLGVPSGTPNEVAAMHAAADLRELVREGGMDETRISVQAYHGNGDPSAPLRISMARFVAEAPVCGRWPSNIGDDTRNLPAPDLGCSNQRNLAAQIANPADLLGPRTMTPASGERRDQSWEKWVKGESTVTEKKSDERAQVKGGQ